MSNSTRLYKTYIGLQLLAVLLVILFLSLPVKAQLAETNTKSIDVTVHYPSEVNAGENFSITATLQNNGKEPELVTVSWSLTPGSLSGSHVTSYRIFSYPLREATPFLRMLLEPGIPRIVSLKEFFYESASLFGGELEIEQSKIRVSARDWQTTETIVEPMHIQITHEGVAHLAEAQVPPPRLPLVRHAIADSENQWLLHDPNTDLEWLPLSRTHMQTLFTVMDKLEHGAEFEGFRVANLDEVETLFLNAIYAAGIQYPSYALFAQDEYGDGDLLEGKALLPVAQELQQSLGITDAVRRPDHEAHMAHGILVGNSDSPNAVLRASITTSVQTQRGQFYLGLASELKVAGVNSSGGVWLVRDGGL